MGEVLDPVDEELGDLPPEEELEARTDAPVEDAPVEDAPKKPSLGARARRLIPWISLGVGAVSAILMDRGPERAWIFTGAAVLVWIVLVTLQWLGRVGGEEDGRVRRAMLGAARFSSLMLTQSLVQLTLFFALPFFVQAATLDAGHALFLLLLGGLSLASLWDPLTEWALRKPGLSAVLPASGSFVALTAVLPGLGLSTRLSLWLAAFVAAAGVPLLAAAQVAPEQRKRVAVVAAIVALALPASLYFGAARIVPAAPLRLVKGEIGTQREGKWIAEAVEHLEAPPEMLICATAIYSPLGLRDQLFHVWRKDGKERARVELDIVGGRKQGYRTQSRIRGFGEGERGEYSCTVETASGQVLGTRSVTIGKRGWL